jgi:hypothetical protein
MLSFGNAVTIRLASYDESAALVGSLEEIADGNPESGSDLEQGGNRRGDQVVFDLGQIGFVQILTDKRP